MYCDFSDLLVICYKKVTKTNYIVINNSVIYKSTYKRKYINFDLLNCCFNIVVTTCISCKKKIERYLFDCLLKI